MNNWRTTRSSIKRLFIAYFSICVDGGGTRLLAARSAARLNHLIACLVTSTSVADCVTVFFLTAPVIKQTDMFMFMVCSIQSQVCLHNTIYEIGIKEIKLKKKHDLQSHKQGCGG